MNTKENTKVLVRLLPANLSSDAFWKLIENKADTILHWYYSQGKSGLKKYVHSRAYIYFKTHEDVCEFNESFNGHVFINSKGGEEKAQVEYAPYQKFPKLKRRADLRMGSITEDADYLAFVEKLKEQPAALPSAEVQLDKRLAEEKEKMASPSGGIIVTPLMEDIRAKRAARNAPRSILQAPKRRSDKGGERKKTTKDDKMKNEAKSNAKPRDRNSRRKRDRDERKKKKKDKDEHEPRGDEQSFQSQGQAQNSQSQSADKSKNPRSGLWTVRNQATNLEPGSITIQTRNPGAAPTNPSLSKPAQYSQPASQPPQVVPSQQFQPQQQQSQPMGSQSQPQSQSQQQARKPREASSDRDFNRNRSKRESKKIYTPKHQQAQTQAAVQPQAQPQQPKPT